MSYRQVIDKQALNVLIKNPNIPDYHLMVGSAERLDGMPLLVYEQSTIPTSLLNSYGVIKEMNSEDIEQAIADNILEVNDLNFTTALIGSGLGV